MNTQERTELMAAAAREFARRATMRLMLHSMAVGFMLGVATALGVAWWALQ